jgi:hypothetical protein
MLHRKLPGRGTLVTLLQILVSFKDVAYIKGIYGNLEMQKKTNVFVKSSWDTWSKMIQMRINSGFLFLVQARKWRFWLLNFGSFFTIRIWKKNNDLKVNNLDVYQWNLWYYYPSLVKTARQNPPRQKIYYAF